MKYNKIRKMDIANGPGVRISVFFQGCSFHCKGCFNQETWDFLGGKEFGEEEINTILDLAKEDYITGLSILGGEPMHPNNIEGTTRLAKLFKEKYPNKTVWAWSGFLFDDYVKNQEVSKYLDVLVEGQFVEDLYNPKLKWRGSSNQRVIDVVKSLKNNKIVLFCE